MEKVVFIMDESNHIKKFIEPFFTGENIRGVLVEGLEELCNQITGTVVSLILVKLELAMDSLGKSMEFLRNLRKFSAMPIIVMSEQTSETAKIMALNAGADDYVTMDCNPLVLMARIKSQMRRYAQLVDVCGTINYIYRADGLEINDMTKSVSVDGQNVRLTPIEYKILRLLIKQRGKVFSINQIYESIWQERAIGVDNTIAVHIRHIREKIETNPKEPRYLKVVWGSGYKVV